MRQSYNDASDRPRCDVEWHVPVNHAWSCRPTLIYHLRLIFVEVLLPSKLSTLLLCKP